MPGDRGYGGEPAGVRARGPGPSPAPGYDAGSGYDAGVDAEVVGCPGVVTVRIPGGESPGEVLVHVRGTRELFVAYTVEALNVGHRVLVDASRGARAVDVVSVFTDVPVFADPDP